MPPRHSFQYGKFISGALQTSCVCFHVVHVRKQEAVLIRFSYHLLKCHQVTCDLKARSSPKERTVPFKGLRCTRLLHWVAKESMKSRHVMSRHRWVPHGDSWCLLLKCKSSRSAEFAVHPFSKFCIQISRSSQTLSLCVQCFNACL